MTIPELPANLKDWGALVGVAIAVTSLAITARETRRNTRISRASFWLDLRRMFAEHNEVHFKLRRGGEWAQPDCGPRTGEEWAKVEAYMGLFEHCNLMLSQGLIDWRTFERIYAYRLRNILRNAGIVEIKLRKFRGDWPEFVDLVERRLGQKIQPGSTPS